MDPVLCLAFNTVQLSSVPDVTSVWIGLFMFSPNSMIPRPNISRQHSFSNALNVTIRGPWVVTSVYKVQWNLNIKVTHGTEKN